MKVTVENKKGLQKDLKVFIDKKTISGYMDEKYDEIRKDVVLKGFRPGKVPTEILKRQFGKAVYGEVIDKVLKDTTTKALEENKIKPAGQPKIDLKSFGEGKDLEYIITVTELPNIDVSSINKIKVDDYEVKIDNTETDKRIDQIAKSQNNFKEVDEKYAAKTKDLVAFDYKATVDGNDFEGNEGKNTQLVLGKDLFIKGFDKQLEGVKKNDSKKVEVNLPENFPKKELINKKAVFDCKINSVKTPEDVKINDDFAKSSLIFTSSGVFTELILQSNTAFLFINSFFGKFSGKFTSTFLLSFFLTPSNCLSNPLINKSLPSTNCVFFPSFPSKSLPSTVAL